MSFRKLHLIVGCLISILLCQVAIADSNDRILHFSSDVIINSDNSLTVSETIQVQATGAGTIQHGIYRDIPFFYFNDKGRKISTDLSISSITVDGISETYHTTSYDEGKRIYIGNEKILLNPGIHTYQIQYRTTNHVRFTDNYDALYWNATGNGWELPIDQVTVNFTLPTGARIQHYAGYTGYKNDKGKDYQYLGSQGNTIRFKTTRPFEPYEGFTAAITWPKGIITPPSFSYSFLHTHRELLLVSSSTILLLIYYFIAWLHVGRDPKKGTIIPLFSPPDNLSPSAVAYIHSMEFSSLPASTGFSAALINMAVKKYLTITYEDKHYTLEAIGTDSSVLSDEERHIAEALFATSPSIRLDRSKQSFLAELLKTYRSNLREQFGQKYFVNNALYICIGGVVTMGLVIGLGKLFSWFGHLSEERVIGSVFLGVAFSYGIWKILMTIRVSIWGLLLRWFLAIILLLWITVYSSTLDFGNSITLTSIFLFSLPPINLIFFYLLQAPNRSGRDLLDKIVGFKQFLSITEAHRYNALQAPTALTIEMFEKYFPYAIALNVEHKWSQLFESKFPFIASESYRPSWYHGSHSGHFSTFGSSFSHSMNTYSASTGKWGSGGGSGGGGGGGW